MKLSIDVEDLDEGESLRTALADPEVRTFCLVMGALLPLTPRARERILMCVHDAVDEELERLRDLKLEEEEEDIQLEEQETNDSVF